jgi:diguanylate cyclase (GGDEF)-like protein
MSFDAPRWALTKWLLRTGETLPEGVRRALIGDLYGSLPIFFGGVANTIIVAALIALRQRASIFFIWLALEIVLCVARLATLLHDRRAARLGHRTFTDLYIVLGLLWAATVGFGGYICLIEGDQVSAMLAVLSAAGMVGGTCLRSFPAPRFMASMILLQLAPCAVGVLSAREPGLWIIALQVPYYLTAMAFAALKVNQMLITIMQAERDNDHRARHDPLTGLANRTGLQHAFDERRSDGSEQTLCYLDLNGFKGINDRYGHAAGDQLLVAVAQRLKALNWPHLFASRVGGDEFVLLAPGRNEAEAARLSAVIDAALTDQPYPVDDVRVPIGVSIGIAFATTEDELGAIMRRADRALYAGKTAGGQMVSSA